MSHEASIHATQTAILRDLLFLVSARFADLQKSTELDSDHFKFHIARLVELEYVAKNDDGSYSLTAHGKEYANKLDTDKSMIERQPKSAVIIVLSDTDGRLLVQERLKHPYYGFWGFPGGKIRWGETIIAAALRELKEETGLGAELTYQGVYHEHVLAHETSEILEDKIFHVVQGTQPTGDMLSDFEGGRNAWLSQDEIATKPHVYKSFDTELSVGLGHVSFVELTQIYTDQEF
jgi:8-oxo-dGTP pyrophosphatase MutT (NUDIX family)